MKRWRKEIEKYTETLMKERMESYGIKYALSFAVSDEFVKKVGSFMSSNLDEYETKIEELKTELKNKLENRDKYYLEQIATLQDFIAEQQQGIEALKKLIAEDSQTLKSMENNIAKLE